MVWTSADVLIVSFAEEPAMQSLGDAATTLGLLFAAIGVGCFVGPIFGNMMTPSR